jgi:hypothetical protein
MPNIPCPLGQRNTQNPLFAVPATSRAFRTATPDVRIGTPPPFASLLTDDDQVRLRAYIRPFAEAICRTARVCYWPEAAVQSPPGRGWVLVWA